MKGSNYVISIEAVPNGYVVRQESYPGMIEPILAVFNKVEDLQAALPELLEPNLHASGEAKP